MQSAPCCTRTTLHYAGSGWGVPQSQQGRHAQVVRQSDPRSALLRHPGWHYIDAIPLGSHDLAPPSPSKGRSYSLSDRPSSNPNSEVERQFWRNHADRIRSSPLQSAWGAGLDGVPGGVGQCQRERDHDMR